MKIKQEILEASWQEHFSSEPELAMFISFEAGFIAGLECQQAAPALLAALQNLVDYCDRRLFQSVHVTQEPPRNAIRPRRYCPRRRRWGMTAPVCLCCELPATHLLADWEVCEAHAAALADPGPACAECGGLLTAGDVEAGETVCLECAGLELLATLRSTQGGAEINLESPLLATVRVGLASPT